MLISHRCCPAPPLFSHLVKKAWIFHEVDIQARISPQDSNLNKKHKNHKFNQKYNKTLKHSDFET